MEKELSIVLLEDDPQACREMMECIDASDDLRLVGVTNHTAQALELIREYLPDVLILDLELPQGGGNGLLLLSEMRASGLSRVPYILITTNNSSAITYESARNLGADFIFCKHQQDYSARQVVTFLQTVRNTTQNWTAEPASAQQSDESPQLCDKRVRQRISEELNRIGVSSKVFGYLYLQDAIQIVMQAPTPNLHSIIGARYGKTGSSVDRAMQTAIARAWRKTPIDILQSQYTAHINPEKGVPTNMEFISYYANKLKNRL